MSKKKVFFLAVLLGMSLWHVCARADTETGLYGYWPLNGNWSDYSGYGLTLLSPGTGGDPVSSANGYIDRCYQFDNSVADMAQQLFVGPVAISDTDGLTVAAWINPSFLESGFTSTAPHTIVRLYWSPDSTQEVDLRILNGNLSVYFSNPVANNLTDFAIPMNQWTFVAFAQSGTTLTVYVNDQKQSFTVDGGLSYDRFCVGAPFYNTARGMNGLIDEVRLYKRALSDSDMNELYLLKPDVTSELYGWWHLDGNWLDAGYYALNCSAPGTYGPPVSEPAGYLGSCYRFSNPVAYAAQCLFPGAVEIPEADGVTLTAWINPTSLENGFSNTAPHTIGNFYKSTSSTSPRLDFRIRDGKLDVYHTNPVANHPTGFAIPLNTWTFVAVTQFGEDLSIYMNDQKQSFTVGQSSDTFDRLILGSTLYNTARGLNGLLDEVRVYRRALSPLDIHAIYTNAVDDSVQVDIASDLYAFWYLDGDLSDSGPRAMQLDSVGIGGDPVPSGLGHLAGSYQFDNSVANMPQCLWTNNIEIPADEITVTAWVKPSVLQMDFTDTSPHTLVRLYDADDPTSNLSLQIRDYKAGAAYANPASNNTSMFEVALDQWNFLAVTQKGINISVYLNGQRHAFRVNAPSAYNRLMLGATASEGVNSARGVIGLLDEVRVYTRALSQDEITTLYAVSHRDADIDQNNTINVSDLALFAGAWLNGSQIGATGDINYDGSVTFDDFVIMAKDWLEVIPFNP